MNSLLIILMLALVCACMWAIVSPRVETGVIGTCGLLLIAFASLTACDTEARFGTPERVIVTMTVGCLLVAIGILVQYWRIHRTIPADRRRRTEDQLRAVRRVRDPDHAA